jgi:hypothetical protein
MSPHVKQAEVRLAAVVANIRAFIGDHFGRAADADLHAYGESLCAELVDAARELLRMTRRQQ